MTNRMRLTQAPFVIRHSSFDIKKHSAGATGTIFRKPRQNAVLG